MRTVQIFVENIRLDLFQDEKIEVTSTVQNIQDISKVYTDFSQSFTVPASKVNNGVFSHYYNNDIDRDVSVDGRITDRLDARIEINHTPFRVGKVQLEGAEIKNNEAESYTITFFGDVVTLKDSFADDKLQDLDFSSMQTLYNGASVKANISTTNDDYFRYPLISSNKIWSYGDGATYDISDATKPMSYDELFPALKVSRIFELIATKYNLTFTGNFLQDTRFTKLFTWWKNRKEANLTFESLRVLFDKTADPVYTNHFIKLEHVPPAVFTPVGYDVNETQQGFFTPKMYHYCDNVGDSYSIEVYQKSAGQSQFSLYFIQNYVVGTAGLQPVLDLGAKLNFVGYEFQYYFKIRSAQEVTVYNVDFNVTHAFQARVDAVSPYVAFEIDNFCGLSDVVNPYVVEPYLDFASLAPDMKISDYFSGILSEFNLTCLPTEEAQTFQLEPLEDWYNYGGELDITPYTIIDSIKIDRPRLYKTISFEYEKSKAFLNEDFRSNNDREYGSLESNFPYDGAELKIKLPFENLHFNKFTDTNLQVSYATTEAEIDKGYIPKACNLYLDESTDCSFYFNDGISTTEIISYVPLGQDTVHNGNNYSSNFGADSSTLKGVSIDNSLYKTYYETYLQNLFNDKTRQVIVKCNLPLSMLTTISLDDLIILRDKKYRINTMKSELTSGMVTLNLLSDWSEDGTNYQTINLKSDANSISLSITPIKYTQGGYLTITDTSIEASYMTCSETLPYTSYAPEVITFIATQNNTGAVRTNTFNIDYYNVNGTVIGQTVLIYVQDFVKNYLLNEDAGFIGFDGKILTNTFGGILL